jgi:hypothetical protein
MLRAVRALAIALLAGALLAGCGSADDTGARNTYVRAVNAVQDRFHHSLVRTQGALDTPTATAAQERRALGRLEQAVVRAVADLRGVHPPGDLAGAHRRLVAALSAYGPVIATRRAASGAGSAREVIAASASFASGSEAVNARVQRAIDQINDQL